MTPIVSILCQRIGLPWTALLCAGLLILSSSLVLCVRTRDPKAGQADKVEVTDQTLFLAPVMIMSAFTTSRMGKPKRKRNLLTPEFIGVCLLNSVIRAYMTFFEVLFQVGFLSLCDAMNRNNLPCPTAKHGSSRNGWRSKWPCTWNEAIDELHKLPYYWLGSR